MRAVRHIAAVGLALGLMLVLPVVTSDGFQRLISDSPDAVTSASLEAEAPSGKFLVLINRDRHPNKDNLQLWVDFFSGREVSFILEDICCTAAASDAAGIEMAKSFQSRLPENQMSLKTEDITLMLSKADNGRFDIIILSAEAAEQFDAGSVCEGRNVEVLAVGGAEEL